MYSIGFLHVDRPEWKDSLQGGIAAAAFRHVGRSSVIDFVELNESLDLAVYLGSSTAANDPSINSQAEDLLRRGVRVLPVVGNLHNFHAEVPTALSMINGMAWTNPEMIAEEVLRHLGLVERDRRVFLSYLRRETTPLAHQLYDELHRRGFFVFLDSFEIEHGALVQNRIEQALHETSFVLLLYSPSVEKSAWIEKEINFAQVHRLGLLALAMPGAGLKMPFHMTPPDRRLDVNSGDLTDRGSLTDVALERICLEIEREHADQFRHRRERLLQDISQALGKHVIRVGMHSIRYEGKASDAFVRVNPRSAQTRDLYHLDRDCAATLPAGSKPLKRVLVAVKTGYKENCDLTLWACTALKHEVRWYEPDAICADPSLLEKP